MSWRAMFSTASRFCPLCGAASVKVHYYGFPMRLCSDRQCGCGWGFWSWVNLIHFDGFFIAYEGSYLKALWFWLSGRADRGEW